MKPLLPRRGREHGQTTRKEAPALWALAEELGATPVRDAGVVGAM